MWLTLLQSNVFVTFNDMQKCQSVKLFSSKNVMVNKKFSRGYVFWDSNLINVCLNGITYFYHHRVIAEIETLYMTL